jgi:RimJ/RimL family protein N-acetyltransferase
VAGVIETERLSLRELSPDDAPFIFELLNDPAFLRFIGDRNVRTLEDARRYVETGPRDSYRRLGFGLYLVESKSSRVPLGICGLLKREALTDVDIGFAFLPTWRRRGYALEAAGAVLLDARKRLGIGRILAICSPGNEASIRLLAKLGFVSEGNTRLSPDAAEVRLFAAAPPAAH